MPSIVPYLWYDRGAGEAAALYTSTFPDSKIVSSGILKDTPSGDVENLSIELFGQSFILFSAGPRFKFNPSISFLVACNSKEEVDACWAKLAAGGQVLMELGTYPFSEWYGWTQDRFGLSWQIMYMGDIPFSQRITPTLMYTGDQCGKAGEAINFYVSVFNNSRVGDIMRYTAAQSPEKEGHIAHAAFTLEHYGFAAMDSGQAHGFGFNEAISLMVQCDTQEEIDYFWKHLSAVPEAEQCGWLKDAYGVSWQIVPRVLGKMLGDKDREKVGRVTQAFLKMKKFDIAALERAYASP